MFTSFIKCKRYPYNYELNKYCMNSTLKSIHKMTREYNEEKKDKFILVKKPNNIHNLSAYVGFLSTAYFLLNFIFIRK
jgi:hypothetical protein